MKGLLIISSLILLAGSTGIEAQQRPNGLLTDLIEHTDRTWQNGFTTNLDVSQLKDNLSDYQYVLIGSSAPSFSWIVGGEKQNTVQEKYRIIVSDNHADALKGIGNIWDSGTVVGNKSTSVGYEGNSLQPDKCYFWRVRTTTNTDGESDWSDVKAFRTSSKLAPYTAAHYPQQKNLQHAESVVKLPNGSYLADFGKDAFGQILLTLTGISNNDSVDVHIGECLKNGNVDREPGGTIRYHNYRLALREGTHTYKIEIAPDKRNTSGAAVLMPSYIGEVLPFRYCEIEGCFSSLKTNDVVRYSVNYPFDETASYFSCNNDTLNQIWDLCKYSIKATSFAGIYVDGDRERIPYEADALINQLSHYGVDREYSMARRSYEYLLDFPTWPTEWILQAIQIAWYDYLYTGDSRSLRATYERLKPRTLMALREKNGMISTTTGLQTPEFKSSIKFKGDIKDIVDWPHTGILGLNNEEGGESDGFVFTDYNVVTNAYHYDILKRMSQIAAVLGNDQDATTYASEAKVHKDKFNRLFFNSKTGTYRDGIDASHSSLHGNMFPLAFGLVDGSRKSSVVNFIKSRGMACSVYGSQFLMDALYEGCDADYALRMLTKDDDRSWYNMIRVGSTISLEAWDNKYKPNQDWNHAWGSAPANIIPRKLVGVEPVVPGFEVVRIKPQIGSLEWVKSKVPTIKGSVEVDIRNESNTYEMIVRIPSNMSADLYIPSFSSNQKIICNSKPMKAVAVKNEPFLYAGKIGSGVYKIEITK